MNNSVNYSKFVDLLIASDDDYEPYGLSAQPATIAVTVSEYEFEPLQAALYYRAMNPSCSD